MFSLLLPISTVGTLCIKMFLCILKNEFDCYVHIIQALDLLCAPIRAVNVDGCLPALFVILKPAICGDLPHENNLSRSVV